MATFLNNFLKLFIFSNLIFYIYYKIIDAKEIVTRKTITYVISSLVISLAYTWTKKYIVSVAAMVGFFIVLGIVINAIVKNRSSNFWLAYVTAFCFAYIIYLVSVCIISLLMYFIAKTIINSPISLVLIFVCSFAIALLIFNTRRLKRGINFIKNFSGNRNTIFVVAVILFCLLVMQDLFQKGFEKVQIPGVILFALVVGFFVVSYVVSQLITKHYRNNIRDRNISIQKEEIDASEKIIGELKEQNLKLATTIHKYNHRLSALENSIRKVMDSSNTEFAKELAVVLEQTKKVKTQFAEETKVSVALPTTNVIAVDNMLEYMKNECEKCGIDFTVKLSDSIIPLLNKYISEDKFETLLGDHIKDAIIAINANHAGYKGIMVLIGIVDNAYELSVYDTGIEFEIPVLVNLGISAITTHKDEGGTGLGFMTTFETLKSSKASLVIEEYDKRVTNYTKSVTIRFDGKCDYRVYSYRAEEIKEQCGRRNIVIKKI